MLSGSRGRARIGVLVPFTNTNLEADLIALRPAGVSLHFARFGGYDGDAVPDAGQMAGLGEASLEEPLRLLNAVRPDVVIYGCTSATLTHGATFDRDLAARIHALSGATTITAAGALVAAIHALGLRRVGFASPYVKPLNDRAIAFLAEEGIETVSRADIGLALANHEQGALTPDAVLRLGKRADCADAGAVVLSCTDMRALETLAVLEGALGKPVVSSNQALLFAALKVLGIATHDVGCGRLFREAVP